jgi:hypothetical protein
MSVNRPKYHVTTKMSGILMELVDISGCVLTQLGYGKKP